MPRQPPQRPSSINQAQVEHPYPRPPAADRGPDDGRVDAGGGPQHCAGDAAKVGAFRLAISLGGWRSAGPVDRGVMLGAVDDHQPLGVVDFVDDAANAASKR